MLSPGGEGSRALVAVQREQRLSAGDQAQSGVCSPFSPRPRAIRPCLQLLSCEWRFAVGSMKKGTKVNLDRGYKQSHVLFINRNLIFSMISIENEGCWCTGAPALTLCGIFPCRGAALNGTTFALPPITGDLHAGHIRIFGEGVD